MPTVESILRTDFKAVDKREPIQSVLGWLNGDANKTPIIVDDGRPIGIVNERAMVRRQLNTRAKLDRYLVPTRTLRADATIEDAARAMFEYRCAVLPIEDGAGGCAGYVRAVDVARARGADQTAADVCLPVRSLKEKETLGEAIHLFSQEFVPCLPVVDDAGRITGVLRRSKLIRMETDFREKGRKDAGGEKLHIIRDAVVGFAENGPVVLPAAARFHDVLDRVEHSGYAIVQQADGGVLGMVTPETLARRV